MNLPKLSRPSRISAFAFLTLITFALGTGSSPTVWAAPKRSSAETLTPRELARWITRVQNTPDADLLPGYPEDLIERVDQLRAESPQDDQIFRSQLAGYQIVQTLYGSVHDEGKSLSETVHHLELHADLTLRRLERIPRQNTSVEKQKHSVRTKAHALISDLRTLRSSDSIDPATLPEHLKQVRNLRAELIQLEHQSDQTLQDEIDRLDYLIATTQAIKQGSQLTLTVGAGILSGGWGAGAVSASFTAIDQLYTDYALNQETDIGSLGRHILIDGATGMVSGGAGNLIKNTAVLAGKRFATQGYSQATVNAVTQLSAAGFGHEVDSIAQGLGAAALRAWELSLDDREIAIPHLLDVGFGAYAENHSLQALLTSAGAAKLRTLMIQKHIEERPRDLHVQRIQGVQAAVDLEKQKLREEKWVKRVEKLLSRPIDGKTLDVLEPKWVELSNRYQSLSQLNDRQKKGYFKELKRIRMKNSTTLKKGRDSDEDKDRARIEIAQKNFEQAESMIQKWISEKQPLSLESIQKINEIIGQGLNHNHGVPGQFRSRGQEVMAGGEYNQVYVPGGKAQPMMQDLINWYAQAEADGMHPIPLAALTYQKLVSIHPFMDGNGRTARFVMDWILMKNNLPPAAMTPSEIPVAIYAGIVPIWGDFEIINPPEHNSSPTKALEAVTQGVERSLRILDNKVFQK